LFERHRRGLIVTPSGRVFVKEEQGARPLVMSPQELAAFADAERKMWARVVKAANIKPD
jgi:tripartite-type tricarboxylate transporter receptor subunit TctC